ncbi:cupredoxin family protein (plasmid) [Rhizobium phaseoli]|nr:cupredoxin family protein [Rhizobium phaseoli]
MKNYLLALAFVALAGSALASGNHAGGHGEKMAVGEPGDKAKATQTIRVTMTETDDGKMLFTPAVFSVRKGQTGQDRDQERRDGRP